MGRQDIHENQSIIASTERSKDIKSGTPSEESLHNAAKAPHVVVSYGRPKHNAFLAAVIFTIICFYYLCSLPDYIHTLTGFILLLLALLTLSALISFLQGIYTSLPSHKDALTRFFILNTKAKKKKALKLHQKHMECLDPSKNKSKKELQKAKREFDESIVEINRLAHIRESMIQHKARRHIGALDTLSVFLTAALTAFLPFMLVNNIDITPVLPWFGPVTETEKCLSPKTSLVALGCKAMTNLPNFKVFVFLASAMPIHILGKVLPKYYGQIGTKKLIFRLYGISHVVTKMFGWLYEGAVYLPKLGKLLALKKTRRDQQTTA